ncbi:MAG: serine/threonine protein kinase [Planctomycetes bacterium]|nr:serine/threonine protein kinase [Planctomycetota bacterium]
MRATPFAPFAAVSLLSASILVAPARSEPWPQWRGPRGDGSSLDAAPLKWNAAAGENVRWKTPLSPRGHSSPIVWNDRIFVTGCDQTTRERTLLCFDRTNGAVVWKQVVLKAPLEKKHILNSYASGTPATDGRHVYVTFLDPDFGSDKERTPGGVVVAAYDFSGREVWRVQSGRFASVHGYCSSPVVFEKNLIVNGDHDGEGYLVALDTETGKTRWRVDRPNNTRSYVTPIIRELAGRTQLLMSGSKCVTSYNPRTGEPWWYYAGPTEQFVASLVDDGELVFLTAGFPEHHMLAIRPDGSGTIDESRVVWHTTKNCSYVPSPAICGKYFLVVSDNGVGSCIDTKTGERLWAERLGEKFSASLVVSGGRVYFTDENGVTKIVEPGPELRVVAENTLGDPCYASPALSDGDLFFRTETSLIRIGEP